MTSWPVWRRHDVLHVADVDVLLLRAGLEPALRALLLLLLLGNGRRKAGGNSPTTPAAMTERREALMFRLVIVQKSSLKFVRRASSAAFPLGVAEIRQQHDFGRGVTPRLPQIQPHDVRLQRLSCRSSGPSGGYGKAVIANRTPATENLMRHLISACFAAAFCPARRAIACCGRPVARASPCMASRPCPPISRIFPTSIPTRRRADGSTMPGRASFDSLNPFIVQGDGARGLFDTVFGNNVFETLMAALARRSRSRSIR